MARIKKYSPEQKLSSFQTFLVDDNPNSDYFRITEFKDTFTGGKNGFLIEGSEYLKESTEIKIELLDVNGDPIYYEPGNGVPEYYEGISKLIAVYIYEDTPIGLGKITILGELKQYDDNGVKRDVPEQWKGAYNVKWERTFQINKNLSNEDKVRFYRRPKVAIDEIVKPIFSKTPNTINQTGTINGTPLIPNAGSKLSNFSLPTSYRITTTDDSYWTGSVVGQTLNVSSLNYSPTITDVVSKTELVVDPPYAPNDVVSSFSGQNYSVDFVYVEGAGDLATALTGSFAKINITDMKTFVGDAARIKVFRRSQSQLSDYEFVQDIQLESTELLRDIETTSTNEEVYGNFTDRIIEEYWVTSSNDITVDFNQTFLYNSAQLSSTNEEFFFTTQSLSISSGVEYNLSFNVRKNSNTSSDDYIKAFLSGSLNGTAKSQTIATINSSNAVLQKTNSNENILADDFDEARLYFEVKGNDWYINNVSLKAAQETAFSPDEITFIQQVPKTLPSETFDYRFEFYDINNNYIPVLVDETKTFTGGNLNLFEKSIELVPDQLYFAFDSASYPNGGNPLPPTIINFEVNTTLVTGSINYSSQSFDFFGNEISASEYDGGQYPGLLQDRDTSNPFLTVGDFTGSRDDVTIQYVRYVAEVEGVSDSVIITRVQDGRGGVNFEIRPFRGTVIKNKQDKDLEVQAIRIDGANEIFLRGDMPQADFSLAKLRVQSGSQYILLSEAADTGFIRGLSPGTTGSGEIDYNVQVNGEAIDEALTLYLMDGPTSQSILTSLLLTDLLDGLGAGFVEFSAEQFSLRPRLDTSYNPVTASVTASFQKRGETEGFISASLVVTPSASIDNIFNTHYYMFYETGSVDRRITVTATDLLDNPVGSGIPGESVTFYEAPETKQLTFNFTYTEDITSASVSVDKTFYIVPEGKPGDDAIVVDIEPRIVQLNSNQRGEIYDYSPLDTDISVKQGRLDLIFNSSQQAGTFDIVGITPTNIDVGTTLASGDISASIVNYSGMSNPILSGSIKYDLEIHPFFTASYFTQSVIQKVTKAVDGAAGIELFINPLAVSLTGDESGNVNDFTVGNTRLVVKQGEEYLTLSDIPTPGTFTASLVTKGIQPTLISASADFTDGTYGDDTLIIEGFNQMPLLSASVDYDVTIYPFSLSNGQASGSTTLRRTQLFTKTLEGKKARTVKLEATSRIVVYDGNDIVVSPPGAITLTALASNLTGSAYYQFFRDGFPYSLIDTDPDFTISSGDTVGSGETSTWRVEVRDGAATKPVVVFDEITIAGVKNGGDAYSIQLSNEAVSVPVEVDGTVNFANTGTVIRAYKGNVELTHVSSYSPETIDGNGDPVGTFGEFSASIESISAYLTQTNIPSGNPATVGNLSGWTNPLTNGTGEVVYKVDLENGRSTFFKTQSFSVSLEGSVGPGIVFRGEYSDTIDYQYSVANGRRDAVIYDKDGSGLAETYYVILQENGPSSVLVAPYGDTDSADYWEEMGTEDLFVAAEIGIFGESFVKNTINIGIPPAGNQNANIAIVGGTDEPYIAVGQSGTQGYSQPGVFLGLTNDGGPYGTSGTFGILSLSGVPDAFGRYNSLEWDGETLTIRGAIRQTAAGQVEPSLRGNWATATQYYINDSVIYNGQSWSANANHTSDIAGGASDGPPGTGPWDASSGTGKTVSLSPNTFVIEYAADGTSPSPSTISLFASSSNFLDPYFKFTGGGSFFTNETTFTDGADGNNDSVASIDISSTTISDMPLQFRVGVSDGDQIEVVSDVINVFGVQPGSDASPFYALTPIAGGTQIKNNSGTIQLQAQKIDSTGISNLSSGNIKIYKDDSSLLNATMSGITGDEYNPTITQDAISGTLTLELRDSSDDSVLDTITLLDVTDGLGGGSFISPNLKTTRDPSTNNFTPTFLSLTASFYSTNGTEYTKAVKVTPNFDGGTDYMYYDNDAGSHTDSEITLTLDNGDGTTFSGTGIGNKLATKDTVVTAEFTDPISGQSNTIVETLYIISDGLDGLDAITVINTNQAHTLPANSSGTVSSYVGSGTNIRVFEGTTELTYDGVGTSDGTWAVTATQSPSSTITIGGITDNGDDITIGNHSSMAGGTDLVTITYSISGKRTNGEAFTSETTQTLTKAKAGVDGAGSYVARLSADNFVVAYDANGSNPSPSSIKLMASSSNFTDGYFKFTGGGASFTDETSFTDGNGANTDSATFSVPSSYSSTPYTFRVGVADGDQTEKASDSITISSVKPGADSSPMYFITSIAGGTQLKNSGGSIELQVQKSDSTGLSNVTSGTDARIFKNDSSLLNATMSGITGDEYNPTLDSTAINGTLNLELRDNSNNVLDTITLLDVTDGLGGGSFISPNLKSTRNPADNSFTPTLLRATASFFDTSGTEYQGRVTITPSFSGGVDRMAVSTKAGDSEVTITADDGDGGTITLGGASVPTKDVVLTAVFTDPATSQTNTINETFYIISDGADGIDALTVILDNETHTIAAESDGTVISYAGSGTKISLYEGTTQLDYDGVGTSDGKWTVSAVGTDITAGSITEDGNDALVNNHNTMTSDSASVEYTISGKRLDGSSITSLTKTQSLTKSKQGTPGTNARGLRISSDSQIFAFDDASDTTAVDDTIRIYIDQQNLSATIATTDITITPTGQSSFNPSSLTGTVTDGTGQQYFDITFSSTLAADKTRLPVEISVTKDSITDVLNIFKVEGGADSDPQYFITPLTGTQIKNGTGNIELQVQSSDPTNGLQNLTTGDIKIYKSDSSLLAVSMSGVSDGGNGVVYNPVLDTNAITGTLLLELRDNSNNVLDTIALLDVTDGLGGGSFISPNLKMSRQSDNSYLPTSTSLTASFYSTNGTEYTKAVKIYPNLDGSTDYMYYDNDAGAHTDSEITLTIDDGDGTVFSGTGIGNKLATKDVVVTAEFTDPVSNQSNTIVETVYIVSDGVDGIDAITIINTNQAHTIPAASDGVVDSGDYGGSGTTIKIYEGTTELSYDGTGTSNGTWTVSTSVSPSAKITVGSITDNGDNITIGNHSSMATDTDVVTITYSISGTRTNGESFTAETTQTITKSKAGITAKNLTVTSDSQVYVFDDAADTTAADDTIRIYINQQNLSGTIGTGDITITDALSSTITTPSLTGTVTNGTGEQYFDLVFDTSTGDITSKTQLPVSILVQKDSITDSTTLNKLEGGASNEPMYFISPLNGTQIKNGAGSLDFQILESAPGALNVVSSGNIKIYSGSNLITTYPGVTGTDYAPTIGASAITGSMLITLKDGSTTYDSIQLLDVTDGLGGGSFISPNLKMSRQSDNSYLPTSTSLTASFYDTSGTEFTKAVAIYPNLDGSTDYMYYDNDAGAHTDSEITLTIDDGDGTVFSGTGIGNKLATKDVVVTATFTDPSTGQTNTMVETVYIVSDGADGLDGTTVFLTNESHAFPANSTGTVTDYSNSGTGIQAYEGVTALTFQKPTSLSTNTNFEAMTSIVAFGDDNINFTESNINAGNTYHLPFWKSLADLGLLWIRDINDDASFNDGSGNTAFAKVSGLTNTSGTTWQIDLDGYTISSLNDGSNIEFDFQAFDGDEYYQILSGSGNTLSNSEFTIEAATYKGFTGAQFPTLGGDNTSIGTVSDLSSFTTTTGFINYVVKVKTSLSDEVRYVKKQSFTKAPAGANGTSGVDGAAGADGQAAGIVYAGEWTLTLPDGSTPDTTDKVVYLGEDDLKYVVKYTSGASNYWVCATTHRYIGAWSGGSPNAQIGDIALYAGTYYIANQSTPYSPSFTLTPWDSLGSLANITPGGTPLNGYTLWESFGAEFTSVATDILFAQDVYADRTINIGSDGSNPVIALNADNANSNANPRIQIGQDVDAGEGFGDDGIYIGYHAGSPVLSFVTSSLGVQSFFRYESGSITLSDATLQGTGSLIIGSEIRVGETSPGSNLYNFRVTPAGNLTANSGSFQGTVSATGGNIGAWSLSSTALNSNYVELNASTNEISVFDSTNALRFNANSGTSLPAFDQASSYSETFNGSVFSTTDSSSGGAETDTVVEEFINVVGNVAYTPTETGRYRASFTYETDDSNSTYASATGFYSKSEVRLQLVISTASTAGSVTSGNIVAYGGQTVLSALGIDSGGGPISVVGNTEMLLSDGSIKLAKDITKDDKILVWNESINGYSEGTISQVLSRTVNSIFRVTAGGKEVEVSDTHGFWLDGGSQIIVTDIIVGETKIYIKDGDDKKLVTVDSVEEIFGEEEVYTLTVPNHVNYISNGIISHNALGGTYPVQVWDFLDDNTQFTVSADLTASTSYYLYMRVRHEYTFTTRDDGDTNDIDNEIHLNTTNDATIVPLSSGVIINGGGMQSVIDANNYFRFRTNAGSDPYKTDLRGGLSLDAMYGYDISNSNLSYLKPAYPWVIKAFVNFTHSTSRDANPSGGTSTPAANSTDVTFYAGVNIDSVVTVSSAQGIYRINYTDSYSTTKQPGILATGGRSSEITGVGDTASERAAVIGIATSNHEYCYLHSCDNDSNDLENVREMTVLIVG